MYGLGRWAVGVALVTGLAFGSAACGDDGETGGGGGDELEDVVVIEGPEAEVNVLDNTFNEQNIQVAPGTKVVWTNNGHQNHDVIATGENTDWGTETGALGPDEVYEYTFEEPGTYRYYCSIHGTAEAGMIGAVVVADQA